MKTVLKWIGIGLGGLIGLLLIGLVGLAIYAQVMFHHKVNRALYPLAADRAATPLRPSKVNRRRATRRSAARRRTWRLGPSSWCLRPPT